MLSKTLSVRALVVVVVVVVVVVCVWCGVVCVVLCAVCFTCECLSMHMRPMPTHWLLGQTDEPAPLRLCRREQDPDDQKRRDQPTAQQGKRLAGESSRSPCVQFVQRFGVGSPWSASE